VSLSQPKAHKEGHLFQNQDSTHQRRYQCHKYWIKENQICKTYWRPL
jgi:hypothetical protein